LGHLDGKRTPLLHTDQRQREEGQTWHRFARQAGKEAIETVSLFPRFADNGLIATHQVHVIRVMQVRAKEGPKQQVPGQHGGKKALDGAVAATGARPARHALHRHPTRHREDGLADPAQLPNGRQPHERCQTDQECDRIAHGLLLFRRWFWVITPTMRQKPVVRDSSGGTAHPATIVPHGCLVVKGPTRWSFWRGYCLTTSKFIPIIC
jgi:hypothetical protein